MTVKKSLLSGGIIAAASLRINMLVANVALVLEVGHCIRVFTTDFTFKPYYFL